MYYYCTYFDRNYLYKGLALYRSLVRHSPPFVLYVLPFDDTTFEVLSQLNLPHAQLVRRADFESGDLALQLARGNRSRVEYYWTCTPSLPLYLFRQSREIDLVTYLDADIFFFDDPSPVFAELGDRSILLTEHRFSKRLRHLEVNGIYNVQMMAFRRDPNGLAALRWWRDRCIEWCYKRLDGSKMGDQKYLDDWPRRFHGVHVLRHAGAGVAPWNFSRYTIETREGKLYVGDAPLIFYHFHQFRILTGGRFYWASSLYARERELPAAVYLAYIEAIQESMELVRQVDPTFRFGVDSRLPVMVRAAARKLLPAWAKNLIAKTPRL